LYLPDIADLDLNTKSSIDANIKAGINRIRTFQLSGGAFSYWPGESYYDSWGSSYAGHFLIEAEKKGYAVPSSVKSAWIRSQKQMANQWSPRQVKNAYNQDDLEQAYRLYTLALAGEAEMSAMNRLRESKTLSVQAKWRLAAAYALSGQTEIAKELISRETTDIQPYIGFYSSYGSRERDFAMLLETLTILNEKTKGAVLAKKISEALSSSMWMSTQTTAYSLMAIAKFSRGSTGGKMQFSYKTQNGKTQNVSSSKSIVQIALPVSHNEESGTLSLTNNGTGILFTRVIMEGIPQAGEEKEYANNLSLQVDYMTTDGKQLDVSEITQGTDFIAVVSVYNAGAFRYTNMALTQIFPPGWEISNSRLTDNELSQENNAPAYQDIRDDRIYTYFDLERNEKKTFMVKLNASYLGRYYLTGTYCEAMYDNSIAAMKKGQWVEVKNAGE
jgi:uncharacterized protein YfaS (alpha-2-macroglobulin family)